MTSAIDLFLEFVEQDADISELEAAVDDADPLAELGRGHAEVDGDGRATDAALGREDGHDAAGLARLRAIVAGRGGRDGRALDHAAELLALTCGHLADGGHELVGAEGLDQEFAGAGKHRAAQVVGLALDAHHHDRCRRQAGRELFRGGDAIHARHVDVHQHDRRVERGGELERLDAGGGRTDHVDVALETEQLREVVAGLRDVVDDEDSDAVCHLLPSAFR
jgi:hypothetical protein